MDEFLYILFLVAWLAFTVYQQNQKKKRKEAARLLESEAIEEQENEYQVNVDSASYDSELVEKVESKPDFRKTLEELLLGEQISLETISGEEAQSLEVIPEKEFVEENKYQEYSEKMTDAEFENLEKEMDLKEEDTNVESVGHYFNLRNAVIYAEILNPKYVNYS
jgi:hypothetical protein